MKQFDYFLYDNYDAAQAAGSSDDPRFYLNESADEILSQVVECPIGGCLYDRLCGDYSSERVDNLIRIGLLRNEAGVLLLDSTVIVQEDMGALHACFEKDILRIAEKILQRKTDFYALAAEFDNGFSAQTNLYHILCGAIFDGSLFECLSSRRVIATSHIHASGLDYLIIAYEKSHQLEQFSERLLCSYNRFTDGSRAIQSFGDADGERVDFFRFSKMKALGRVPIHLAEIENAWDSVDANDKREWLLDEMQRLVDTGRCDERCLRLMSLFGYAQNGEIAVPIYRREHVPLIEALEKLAEECVLDEMINALSVNESDEKLLCVQHGVSRAEIANEMYHILFGQLNEILTGCGFVACPPYREGEGRYLQSIMLM